MLNNDFRSDNSHEERGRRAPQNEGARPLADREVPLNRTEKNAMTVMHQWLDGETPEAAVRAVGGEREITFWKALEADLETRRQARAPLDLEQRIMAALPQNTPSLITPWHSRPMEITPVVMLGAAATLVAVGLLLGVAMAR